MSSKNSPCNENVKTPFQTSRDPCYKEGSDVQHHQGFVCFTERGGGGGGGGESMPKRFQG